MTERSVSDREEQESGPTIRDKRRIDPQTYEVREPQAAAAPAPDTSTSGAPSPQAEVAAEPEAPAPAVSDEVAELTAALADRTLDLQRLQAEYVNYKRRVDRDRDRARVGGIEAVLREMLTVLDSIGYARQHEELSPGFKAVVDELERVTTKFGLISYGEVGDPFDPHIHEALMHTGADSVEGIAIEGPTCVQILQPGYQIGERILRPARVAVADPVTAS